MYITVNNFSVSTLGSTSLRWRKLSFLCIYFRINKFEMEEVPEEAFGEFYMGDCYITLYAYSAGDKEHFLIYYWLVSRALP